MRQIKTRQDIRDIEAEMPLADRKLPSNTWEMLQRGAAINPHAPALKFFLQAQGSQWQDEEVWTFEELLGKVRQAANLFRTLGVEADDVVSFVLPNIPETHFTIWGAQIAGIVNPINPLLEADQIADIMNAAGSKVLVTLMPFPKTDLWQKIDQIRMKVPGLKTILRVDLADHLGGLTKMGAKLFRGGKLGVHSYGEQQVLPFQKLMDKQNKDKLNFKRNIQKNDISSYFHTGGTTGLPKLAAHTHWNEVYDSWAMLYLLNEGQHAGQNFFCGLPLFHVNGVFVTGLGPWSSGGCVILGPPQGYRTPGLLDNFWKIVAHYKINFFSGVPTVYSKLLEVPIAGADVSSLEFAICGAAPLPLKILTDFEARTGMSLLEGYGCTEGACASSINPAAGERRAGSIGFPLPYQEMKAMILDEKGVYIREAKPDEIGIIAIRGANVFPGYKEPRQNEGIWIETGDDQGPWYNTGDLGREDAEGYFWLTGRKKEVIIRGGHNIDPSLIEEPMYQHPDVELCAAVAKPDAKLGEVPVLYVQLKEGATAQAQDLYDFAQAHIKERAAIPQGIRILDAMPLTAVGKIFKPQLCRQEIKAVFTQEVQALDGIADVYVDVVAHKTKGTLARVRISPKQDTDNQQLTAETEAVLGVYSVAFEVVV